MAGSKRPALQAPELPATPAIAVPPRTDPDDARFTGAEQFETHEALLRGVQNGSVRTINPETMPRVAAKERDQPPEPPRRRGPEVSLSTKVPEYVMVQLRRRYADTGITIRNQVLLALRKEGFEIQEDDLQDERKRPRR
ncbi:MAG TPA: hypothetical protein VFE56_13445 [Candidatus Binataceae bacterium]|jgi:hypothetical protein|nr:hypothetical protein [Candidatus Binataceae bacterium]